METSNIKNIKGALTDKGNLKRAVATNLREQGVNKFLLENDFELTPKGEYVRHIADADGKPVYLRVSMSVSVDAGIFDEPKSSAKAPVTDEVEIGSIFG